MENKALWEISDELLEFMSEIEIDPETGEISEESFSKIESLSGDFDEKLENCINYLRRTDAESKLAKQEAELIKQYGKTLEKKVERLSEYIKHQMLKMLVHKTVISGRPASIAKNPDSLIVDESILPKEWMRVKVKEEPDKVAIMKHIKNGKEVPEGVEVVRDKTRLKF